jgi:hypothetical protein
MKFAPTFQPALSSSPPIKTGMKGTGSDSDREDARTIDDTDLQGGHSAFVVVRDSDQGDETPVFRVENADADGILIFAQREAAVFYLQVAAWDGYRARELSPIELGHWAPALEESQVAFLIVSANRHHQIRGDMTYPAIDLRALRDLTGENLYREVLSVV